MQSTTETMENKEIDYKINQSARRTRIIDLTVKESLKPSAIAKLLKVSLSLIYKDLGIIKSKETERMKLEYHRKEFLDDYERHMKEMQGMVDYAFEQSKLNDGQVSVGFLGNAMSGKRTLIDSMHKKAETLQKYGLVPPFDRSQITSNVNLTEENQIIIQRIVNLWSVKNGIETAKPIEIINR